MKSNAFCDLVPSRTVPAARMREIESVLTRATGLIKEHWSCSGLPNRLDFFAEFMRSYAPGRSVLVGGALVSPDDAKAMMMVKEVEEELLAGFSRMIQKETRSCARRHGRDPADLQADAYESFFRAMINYSGETQFSTYLWWSLSRNLDRACSKMGELKVPRDVRRIAMRVVGAMRQSGLTFDEALESSGVSNLCKSKVVSSMSRVRNATELEMEPSDIAAHTDRDSMRWVLDAVARAKLGRLEKAVVQGFMESPGDVMGLSEGCRGMVNPDTGRPYSRSAISAAWRQAKKKIAKVMDEAA